MINKYMDGVLNAKLSYGIDGLKSLTSIFLVIREIHSETGLYPESITLKDDKQYRYDKEDALFVEKGAFPENEYLKKHLI